MLVFSSRKYSIVVAFYVRTEQVVSALALFVSYDTYEYVSYCKKRGQEGRGEATVPVPCSRILRLRFAFYLTNLISYSIYLSHNPPKSSSTSQPQPSAFKCPTPCYSQRRSSPVHIAADPPTPVSPMFPLTFWSRGTHRLHGF